MQQHRTKERTLVIVKPDGVQRGLMGEVVRRIERTGLKLIGCKFTIPTEAQCLAHYHKDEVWFEKVGVRIVAERQGKGEMVDRPAAEYGKDILRANVSFMTSGPVLAMVFQGNQAVGIVKKLVGGTEPLTSDVGTIRGDLTVDSYDLAGSDGRAVRNLVHCSDVPAEAEREIPLWFSPQELLNYRLVHEEILYDVNLDGILE
jgi:nucleoside-diphosphate kinase